MDNQYSEVALGKFVVVVVIVAVIEVVLYCIGCVGFGGESDCAVDGDAGYMTYIDDEALGAYDETVEGAVTAVDGAYFDVQESVVMAVAEDGCVAVVGVV